MAVKTQKKKKDNKKIAGCPPGANEKFLSVAAALSKAKWITALILLFAVLSSVIFAGDELTVYNLQYLMKHFDVNSEGNSDNFATLKYESDASYSFAYYKDDFVIINSTNIDYYDMRGNSVMSDTLSMSDPTAISTEKYLYVYDQGNVSYSVYDSFFNVHSDVLQYPIRDFATCDEGSYAIVTRSLEYRGVVYFYDKNFKLKNEIYKDKLIFDVALSSDGSRIAVLSAETNERGEFYTEVQSLAQGSEEPEFTKTIEDCFPVGVGYFANGNLGVVCQDRLIVFGSGGGIIGEYKFVERTPTSCSFNGDVVTVSFGETVIGVNSRLLVFDAAATLKTETVIDGQVKKILLDDSYAYVLLTDAVARVDLSDGTTILEQTGSNPLDVLVRGAESLLLCYGNHVDSLVYAFTGINE